MDKKFFVIVAVLVIGFFGLLFFNKDQNSDSSSSSETNQAELTDHTAGEGTSGVTLTEYGDFQCPACGQYFPIVDQLKKDYGDELTVQFRHFPLQTIHQNALISSRAAEAAGMQDKFFEMHDLLYANQQQWSASNDPSSIFVDYAKQIGLDTEQFKEDLKSSKVNKIVQADLASANKKGYTSTPTFEINGEKIENPSSLDEFKEKIDKAIDEQKSDNNKN